MKERIINVGVYPAIAAFIVTLPVLFSNWLGGWYGLAAGAGSVWVAGIFLAVIAGRSISKEFGKLIFPA